MNTTHISLNPNFCKLPEDVKNIEKHVYLQKEMDFYVAKRRYIEEQIAFCANDDLKRELVAELLELEEQLIDVQSLVPLNAVADLRQVISSYMKVYQLTYENVAKLNGTSVANIEGFLNHRTMNTDQRKFAIWAIQMFRLDANLYLNQLLEEELK